MSEIPTHIFVDNVKSFSQEDEDNYELVLFVDDADTEDPDALVRVWLRTFEAVRLYQLLKATIGPYVAEMEAAKESHARGFGPNGEAPGTWEHSRRVEEADRTYDDWAEWADNERKKRMENRA